MGRGMALLVVAALFAAPAAASASPSPDPGIHWESYLPDMPPTDGPQPHGVPGCAKATLRCIDTEIRNMTRAQKRFGCDHRGVFDTTYLVLTRALKHAVQSDRNLFEHLPYLYTEDALFADVYFRTLRSYAAGRPVPPAWQVALDTARSGEVNAGQDMLLGINAHVQNDMPFVIAALGLTTRAGASRKPDHDAVNDVLAQAYQPVIDAISSRFDPLVAMTNASWDPVDDIAGLELVREWREEVWRNAERLIEAKTAADRRQVADQIQENAGAWAQGMAAAQQSGYRATRDAYCRAQLKKKH